jgi:hypothetical protein
MHVLAAGYSPAELVWTNVAAGTYVITAAVNEANAPSTVSTPMTITVQP